MILRQTEEAIEITNRFFKVIDALKLRKDLRGLQTFTRKYGLNFGNMSTLKNHPDRCFLKPEYISIVVRDYGANPRWILLGEGDMFCQEFA